MNNFVKTGVVLPLLVLNLSGAYADAGWGDNLSNMVTDGKASVDFRYRYEGVDEGGFAENAKASTLRSRLTLESAAWNGFTAMLEMDDVRAVGVDDYNSTVNGKIQYPVVADPAGTDLNQAWLKYSHESADGILGRQRVLHGNQRFVGGVAWRQNEQTFDGIRVETESTDKLKLDFSYITQVNRIYGPDDGANPAVLDGQNFFFRGDYEIVKTQKVVGYVYLLDIDPQAGYGAGKTVNNSSNSLGVEYDGSFGLFSLGAALALQTDAGNSTLNYSANYYRIDLLLKLQPVNLYAGYEVLGGDNGTGFATPLATLHKFQGWADKFLTTPGDGIKDFYIGVNGMAGPVKLGAVYHDFQAESSAADFGSEIDLIATWSVNKQFSFEAKYADFSTNDSSRFQDTTKGWLTLQLKL
jgi:hypothetical protein